MAPIPLGLQTLYADLVQQVHASPSKAGSVYVQKDSGKEYLYVRRAVGSVRLDRFLGPASNRAAQDLSEQIRIDQRLAKQRRKIVSLLKRSGIPAPSTALARVLDALADAGLFATAVLVGTGAYQCYSPMVGWSLPTA